MENEDTNQKKVDSPILIMVRGIPGSGKSHLSKLIANNLPENSVLLLDPDEVNINSEEFLELSENLKAEGLDEKIHPFRWLRNRACAGISSSKVVIWNQPFTNRGIFDRLVAFIKNNSTCPNGNLRVLLVEIKIDRDEAFERVKKRIAEGGHGPSYETFVARAEQFTSFADDYESIIINATEPTQKSVDKILEKLDQLYF